MIGYIVLGVFIVFVVASAFFFFTGLRHGRKLADAEYAEEQRIKAQNEKDYKKAASEIKQEVFHESEQKKAGLAGGSSGRDRFNNANSALNSKL
jgi:Flp pilus assembly protein TadB